MFGWSMFFGVCGAITFLSAGALFMVEVTARRERQPKGEQKQKSFLCFASLSLGAICLAGGCILFVFSYYFFYWNFAGKITAIDWLNPKSIYRVGGQAKIEEQNAVFLGDAGKDVWCVSSEPLDPMVRFVRAAKTPPPENKWVLESVVNIPKKE